MLPRLHTEGRHIKDADGNIVILRGLNRSGLEYTHPAADESCCATAGITDYEMDLICRDWGARIIRVPFNQEWLINGIMTKTGDLYTPDQYLGDLDQFISMAAARGAYTLLDLQWEEHHDAPLPNRDSLVAWTKLAQKYGANPAVLFDLFTEPHSPDADARNAGKFDVLLIDDNRELKKLEADRVDAIEWQKWARHLITNIRQYAPETLLFVSGFDWAKDLRGVIFENEAPDNIVYSVHIYPVNSGEHDYLDLDGERAAWNEKFGQFADRVPLFAGEWGPSEGDGDRPAAIPFLSALAAYLDDLDLGWTAWSWSDEPRLVAGPGRTAPDYSETRFGTIARAALRTP